MTKFRLIPYTIRIRKKKDKKYLQIDDFEGYDLFDVIMKALEDLKDTKVDDDSSKTISTERYQSMKRQIVGTLRVGEYGIGADFFNIKKHLLVPEARTIDDSELLPFFVHFHLPKKKDVGFMVLQTFQHHGIKRILSKKLRAREEFSNYMVEFKRLISGEALKALMQGDLLSISFVRHSIPKDVGSQIGKAGRMDIEEVRTFRIKGNFALSDRLRDALANKDTKYYEISDDKYDEAKAVVKIGSSEVVLVFGEENTFNMFLPLDDYDKLVDGFPTFEYILEKSSSYITDLEKLVEG